MMSRYLSTRRGDAVSYFEEGSCHVGQSIVPLRIQGRGPGQEVFHDYRTQSRCCDRGSQGIGAGLVRGFLDRGYQVVANSRSIKPDASRTSSR